MVSAGFGGPQFHAALHAVAPGDRLEFGQRLKSTAIRLAASEDYTAAALGDEVGQEQFAAAVEEGVRAATEDDNIEGVHGGGAAREEIVFDAFLRARGRHDRDVARRVQPIDCGQIDVWVPLE